MFLRFRSYEIDNPWYLSFSRSFWVDHVGGDSFLNGVFPNGMGGTAVFGRGPALVQGAVLNRFGWMPLPALLLSTVLVLAGLALWYGFLRRGGLSREQGWACVLALGVLEPFLDMADRFRYEPYSFLIMAGAFWLAAMRRPWLAMAVGLMAFETEPAAAMVFAAVCLYLLRSGWRWRTLLPGAVIALAWFAVVYGVLHPGIAGTLRATDWHRVAGQQEPGGFLQAYFIDRKRHLVELVLLTVCAVIFGLRYVQAPAPVRRMAEVTALATVFSFAMRWPTPAYMVFWYPAAIVVAAWCLSLRGWSPWVLPCLAALLMLPQYGALAWINRHEGFRVPDLKQVREALQASEAKAGIDDRQVKIMGDYSLWFAHPAGYQALAHTTLSQADEKDLFLCFDAPLRPWPMFDPLGLYCASVPKTAVEVDRMLLRGHTLRILVSARRAAPPGRR